MLASPLSLVFMAGTAHWTSLAPASTGGFSLFLVTYEIKENSGNNDK